MKEYRQYSHLFSCMHDQPEPVGSIGNGAHYSVFRCAQNPMNSRPALIQDFCIVWDEDHDERIISVVERLLMDDLLSPVLFIGERKGGLTVMVGEDFVSKSGSENFKEYAAFIERIADSLDDSWGCSVGSFDAWGDPSFDVRTYLLNESRERTQAYLAGINACWSLGLKQFEQARWE